RALNRAIFAVDRPHAPDVASVVADVRRVVHQHQLAVFEPTVVAIVVRVPDIFARGDDGAIALVPHAIHPIDVVGDRAKLILGHAGPRGADRLPHRQAAQLPGPAHRGDLA